MPLNSLPPTTTVHNLNLKRQAAEGQCHTDIAFWGGVIPGNQVRDTCPCRNQVLTIPRIDAFKAIAKSWCLRL